MTVKIMIFCLGIAVVLGAAILLMLSKSSVPNKGRYSILSGLFEKFPESAILYIECIIKVLKQEKIF